METFIYRVQTKPGYKVLATLLVIWGLLYLWSLTITTALVDSDGYVYAMKNHDGIVKYLDIPTKLNREILIECEVEYDK